MNDLTSVNDDSLDEGLRSVLLQIDAGPALTVVYHAMYEGDPASVRLEAGWRSAFIEQAES